MFVYNASDDNPKKVLYVFSHLCDICREHMALFLIPPVIIVEGTN